MKARDMMSAPVITVTADTTIKDLAALLVKRAISAAQVVDHNGDLMGIVSEADLVTLETTPDPRSQMIRFAAPKDVATRVRQVMKATVVYLAGEHEFFSPGRWDCVTANPSPVIAVLEGGSHPPRGRNGFAIVGGEAGPIGMHEALATLFDGPDRPEEPGLSTETGSGGTGF